MMMSIFFLEYSPISVSIIGLKPDQGRVLKAVMAQTSTTSSRLAQHILDYMKCFHLTCCAEKKQEESDGICNVA